MTLIVFGYGPIEINTTLNLNIYARLNALAAGTLYQRGGVERMIITGGRTGGADLPSEAEAMKRVLKRYFDVPDEVVILEHQATDTVTNFVYIANSLDNSSLPTNLGFLAFGFHLPRIQYLADLFGLTGASVAAEEVVRERSERYRKLLRDLLSLENEAHRKLLTDQVRALRGLDTLPEYWLPPAAQLQSEARLASIMRLERVQTFLGSRGLEPQTPSEFKAALSTLSRRFPEPKPEDRAKALGDYEEVARV